MKMKTDRQIRNVKEGIKSIFSIISLFLMAIPLFTQTGDYYRTLFIFLINYVIDLFCHTGRDVPMFFVIWHYINQWLGAVICALSFCLIIPDFYKLFSNGIIVWINIGIFLMAISFVLKDFTCLAVISFKEMILQHVIRNDIKNMRGGKE